MTAAGGVTVHLQNLPVRGYLEMQQQHDAMLRELALISVGAADPGVGEVPRRLLELTDEMRTRFSSTSGQFRDRVMEAHERGEAVTTVSMPVPPETLRWAEDFLMLFEEGDEFCRTGQLLTPPSAPRVAQMRRWIVGELIRQVRDKAPPAPFSGSVST